MMPIFLLIFISSCSHAAPKDQRQYLLPLITHGPNNQLGQFKHAIKMAKMLDRTVILPPLFEHYSDVDGKNYRWLGLHDILDMDLLKKVVPVVTADEAKEAGWDGFVSGSLNYRYMSDIRKYEVTDLDVTKRNQHLRHALRIKIPSRSSTFLTWTKDICDPKGLSGLRKLLADYKVVLVWPSIVDPTRYADGQLQSDGFSNQSLFCQQTFLEVGSHFQMSSRLRRFALGFIEEAFPDKQPFAAAHIRPYPDNCLHAWADPTGNKNDLRATCGPIDMEKLVVNKLRAIVDKVGGKGLFVLAHPSIRWRIDKLLSPHSIVPVYLEPESKLVVSIEEDLEWPHGTSSLLLLLEQSVAVLASDFVGSHRSSATWSVIDHREAEGGNIPPHFFMEKTQEKELRVLYQSYLDSQS